MKITFNLQSVLCGGLSVAALALSLFISPLFLFCPFPLLWLAFTGSKAELYGAVIVGGLLITFITGFQAVGLIPLAYAVLMPGFLGGRALLNKTTNAKTFWYPAGLLMRDLWVCLSALCAIVFALIYTDTQTVSFADAVKALETIDGEAATVLRNLPSGPSLFGFIMESLSALMTWLMGLGIIISAATAQAIGSKKGTALRPTLDITSVRVPLWMIILFLVGLGSEFIVDGMAQDLLFNLGLVAAFPLFFSGCGMIHTWIRPLGHPRSALIAFYISIFFIIWMIIPIIILGIYHSLKTETK